jgi:hypothetical protein
VSVIVLALSVERLSDATPRSRNEEEQRMEIIRFILAWVILVFLLRLMFERKNFGKFNFLLIYGAHFLVFGVMSAPQNDSIILLAIIAFWASIFFVSFMEDLGIDL